MTELCMCLNWYVDTKAQPQVSSLAFYLIETRSLNDPRVLRLASKPVSLSDPLVSTIYMFIYMTGIQILATYNTSTLPTIHLHATLM